ncbi:MAG: non-canonical purine NTP pyrophosphatase [Pseudomonadota bacterium]
MGRRRLEPGRLVVASHNEGKVREIRDLLAPFGMETVSAAELALPEPEETETTYEGNARLKAHAAAGAAALPALADDSGLSVDVLDGAPGIYSARWAETGTGRDFGHAMARVRDEATAAGAAPGADAGPAAAFICALSLAWPDGYDETFLGRCPGVLVWPPRGGLGFGYDPMFLADGETETFGEMAPERKHGMSHRADAFRQLVAACLAPGGAGAR